MRKLSKRHVISQFDVDNTPEEWEMEMMNQEISPEAEDKKRLEQKEVPTDPRELERLQQQQQMKKKLEQGYDPDVDLLVRMESVLKRIEDFDDYAPDYDSEYDTILDFEMDADDFPPTYEPSESPSQSQKLPMPSVYEPSGKSNQSQQWDPRLFQPSGPSRK